MNTILIIGSMIYEAITAELFNCNKTCSSTSQQYEHHQQYDYRHIIFILSLILLVKILL